MGRVVERTEYRRDGAVTNRMTHQFLSQDTSLETCTQYLADGGRVEVETFHLWETHLSFATTRRYAPDGALIDQSTTLLGSEPLESRPYSWQAGPAE